MDECVVLTEEDPRQCIDGWLAAPGAAAAQLDTRHGVDPHCGTCLFVFGACLPGCPLAPVMAAALGESMMVVCCCPWLIGWRSLQAAGEEMV